MISPDLTKNRLNGQRGQMLGGYIIALLIAMAITTAVVNSMRRSKLNSESRVYRELALNVARMGFEDGLSYFRRQPDGVYLDAYPSDSPSSSTWVTPWPQWPDAAFLPKSADTDHYTRLSFTAGGSLGTTASAILRSFPMNAYSLTATAVESKNSQIWGRYVLRRQNQRNWSPGPNTMNAFTDPEAIHDLTHIRGQAKPGNGNYWSLFSRAYVFANNGDLTVTAAHENSSLLSSPKRFYNGKRLLLATASVYGELYRINFNLPVAAAFCGPQNITVNARGTLTGKGQARSANATGAAPINAGGTIVGNAALSTGNVPSVAYCFPGLDEARLQAMAASIDPTHVGGVDVLPRTSDANFSDTTSQTSFYFINGNATLLENDTRVLSGVGLVFVKGNLTIQRRNASDWNGVVFVDGSVSLRDRATISGILVATKGITIGTAGDISIAEVQYNQDTIDTVQTYLQDFRVLSSSILTSAN